MAHADTALQDVVDRPAFRLSTAPYLLLDLDLRIRAANPAYERATHHEAPAMVGEHMFEVFPDNPATPEARSVERLAASFERALRHSRPDRMGLQRYDVVDGDHGFVLKTWLPVNSPVRDADGTTVGVLHHVEDVTRLLGATGLERDLASPPRRSGGETLRRDSRARLARARRLVEESERALERVSHRLQDQP